MYFFEHCWPWSYYIGIICMLGILNQVRNVGISVIRTISLIWTLRNFPWPKGSDNRGSTVQHYYYSTQNMHSVTNLDSKQHNWFSVDILLYQLLHFRYNHRKYSLRKHFCIWYVYLFNSVTKSCCSDENTIIMQCLLLNIVIFTAQTLHYRNILWNKFSHMW